MKVVELTLRHYLARDKSAKLLRKYKQLKTIIATYAEI